MPELKQITFSLFEHVYKQLEDYCDQTGQNKTAVLRQAVFEFLSSIVKTCKDNFDEIIIRDTFGNRLGTIDDLNKYGKGTTTDDTKK